MFASRMSPKRKKLNRGGGQASPGRIGPLSPGEIQGFLLCWLGRKAVPLHMLNFPYAQVGLLIQLGELAILSVGTWTIIVEELGG